MILKKINIKNSSDMRLHQLLTADREGVSAYVSTHYAIVGNTDDVEGRGASFVRALAEESSEAHKAAAHAGPMGSRGDVYPINTLDVVIEMGAKKHVISVPLKDVYVSASIEDDSEALKKNALAKLTDDEKRVLGLLK